MDAWKQKYHERKLTIKYEENKVLNVHTFYLVVDGVKNTQNYIQYDEEEKCLMMVNEGSFKV